MDKDPKDILDELNNVLGEEVDEEAIKTVIGALKEKVNRENYDKFNSHISKVIEQYATLSDTQKEIKTSLEGIFDALKGTHVDLPQTYPVEVANPVKEVRVSNIKDIVIPTPHKEVKISNLSEMPDYKEDVRTLAKLLGLMTKVLTDKELKVDLDRYTEAKRALAVRLTDGKKFYEAISQGVSSASVGLEDTDGIQIVKLNSSGDNVIHQRVTNTDGNSTAFTSFGASATKYNYVNYISVYNSSATDGYVDFRDGTSGAVLWTVAAPSGGGSNAPVLFKTSLNTALAYDVSGALSTVYISVSGYKASA